MTSSFAEVEVLREGLLFLWQWFVPLLLAGLAVGVIASGLQRLMGVQELALQSALRIAFVGAAVALTFVALGEGLQTKTLEWWGQLAALGRGD